MASTRAVDGLGVGLRASSDGARATEGPRKSLRVGDVGKRLDERALG